MLVPCCFLSIELHGRSMQRFASTVDRAAEGPNPKQNPKAANGAVYVAGFIG
jgi:hypothetical protein